MAGYSIAQLHKDMVIYHKCLYYNVRLKYITINIPGITDRNVDRYVFKTDITHKDIYGKSPYLYGVCIPL